MSEWGIEQPSSFGNAGGCFVESLSLIGGVVIIVALISLSHKQTEQIQNNNTQSKVESVKQNPKVISQDTIVYHSTNNLCR